METGRAGQQAGTGLARPAGRTGQKWPKMGPKGIKRKKKNMIFDNDFYIRFLFQLKISKNFRWVRPPNLQLYLEQE